MKKTIRRLFVNKRMTLTQISKKTRLPIRDVNQFITWIIADLQAEQRELKDQIIPITFKPKSKEPFSDNELDYGKWQPVLPGDLSPAELYIFELQKMEA